MKFDDLSGKVIGFAIEVHRNLGPGLLESAYRMCLAHELSVAGISFQMELPQPLRYKEILLDCGYRLDVLVNRELLIETKSVEALLPIHHAQTLTYMRLAGVSVGLLINFNVIKLQNGIKRFVL
jgi:GxxExxY protein